MMQPVGLVVVGGVVLVLLLALFLPMLDIIGKMAR
jgi:type II secretory pathway component PulF